MRIVVVSNLFPPVVRGGYEAGCGLVIEHLRERGHDVHVLTSSLDADATPVKADVERTLALLSPDRRGALRAPLASLRAAAVARRALERQPDLLYVWNGASIPQSALRVLADSGLPLAFRVEEHWIAKIFREDQFLRELFPAERSTAQAAWSIGCRALNALPAMHLHPTAPVRCAITWNSEAIRRMAPAPPFFETVMERVIHPAPPNGDMYASIVRAPAPQAQIAFMGRVTPSKGVDVAVRALALLRSEHGIEASLDIAGPEDGDHGEELRRLAHALGIAEAVRWHGPQSAEQIAALLARTHALIVPSTWDEPFPYVTIEGALARVPLVASDVGGIGEGMHDEEHALLFARGDAGGAAVALARTLSDTEATTARVARAYERAQSFRRGAYLEQQERFVQDALSAMSR